MAPTATPKRQMTQIHDIMGLDSAQTTNSIERRAYPGSVRVRRYRDQEPEQKPVSNNLRQVIVGNTESPSGPRMAAEFISSDSSLFVYRRFGALAARRLATMQLELSQLEREWGLLEERCRISHGVDSDEDYERKTRLERLQSDVGDKLERYHKTMLLQSRICALESPSPEVVTSLRNWYDGEQHIDEQYEYLNHVDDLAALAGREGAKDWLQKFLEKNFAAWYPLRLEREIYKSDKITAYSEEVAAKLSRVILTVGMLLLIMMALVVLAFLNSYYARLAFAAATLVFFSAGLSLTSARSSDIVVATAGYASVMSAFLQKSS